MLITVTSISQSSKCCHAGGKCQSPHLASRQAETGRLNELPEAVQQLSSRVRTKALHGETHAALKSDDWGVLDQSLLLPWVQRQKTASFLIIIIKKTWKTLQGCTCSWMKQQLCGVSNCCFLTDISKMLFSLLLKVEPLPRCVSCWGQWHAADKIAKARFLTGATRNLLTAPQGRCSAKLKGQ